MPQIRRGLLLKMQIPPKLHLEAVIDRYQAAIRHLKVAATTGQSMSMEYFQHPRVPNLQLICQSIHISLVKTNGVYLSTDKELNLRGSNSRRPPLHDALGGTKCNDCVASILGHSAVVIPGVVICDDLASGGIEVPQPAIIMQRQQEMVRKVLQGKSLWQFVQLNASIIVDEGVLWLDEGQHFLIVQESTCEDLLLEIQLKRQVLLPPIQHSQMPLRTSQHQSRPIPRVRSLIIPHIQLQLKRVDRSLDIDCRKDIPLLNFDSLIALKLRLEESRLEVVKQLREFIALVDQLFFVVMFMYGLVQLFVLGEQPHGQFGRFLAFQHSIIMGIKEIGKNIISKERTGCRAGKSTRSGLSVSA